MVAKRGNPYRPPIEHKPYNGKKKENTSKHTIETTPMKQLINIILGLLLILNAIQLRTIIQLLSTTN